MSDRVPQQSASEDFSDIPAALGMPYTCWGIGGIDRGTYRKAEQAGRVQQDIPVNHSPAFAPVIQPHPGHGHPSPDHCYARLAVTRPARLARRPR